MEERCENCRYAKLLGHIERLICRRYPPSIRVEGRSHDSYYFPIVNADEWCGEFEPNFKPGE